MTTEPSKSGKLQEPVVTSPAPAQPGRKKIIQAALGSVVVIAVLWGIMILIHSYFYESTDDAFIEGHVVTIGTKLSNTVKSVLIDDNTEVTKGELLVQIDPRDYEVQLHEAEANYTKAQSDNERNEELVKAKAISEQELDATRAAMEVASAQLDQARLNLSYTRITAPVAGRITRKNVEPGDYVETGQTLFSIVPNDIWIIANFKETQLTNMKRDQPVTIRVDAFPGRVFKGKVDSIQAGTGARFSLLPAENATGNYVKVVQRVPVKIRFDETPEVQALFTPGLSVTPEVKVR